MTILDRFDDGSRLITKASARAALPSRRLPYNDSDFAYRRESGEGAYPLYTEEEALASAAYFHEYGGNVPIMHREKVASKILQALEDYGIGIPSGLEKTAFFHLGYSDAEGKDLNNEEADAALREVFGIEAGDAAKHTEDFLKGTTARGKLRFAMRSSSSQEKLASLGFNDPTYTEFELHEFGTDLYNSIMLRGYYDHGVTPELQSLYEKVARMSPPDAMEAIESFDMQHNLCRLYDLFDMPDAFDTVYGRKTEKLALNQKMIEVNGKMFDKEELSNLLYKHMEKISSVFGSELAAELKKRPVEVFDSLPDRHKMAIVKMLK